jgi:hypothetical protein
MESEMNCLFVGCKMWVIIDAKGKSRGLDRGKLTCRVLWMSTESSFFC